MSARLGYGTVAELNASLALDAKAADSAPDLKYIIGTQVPLREPSAALAHSCAAIAPRMAAACGFAHAWPWRRIARAQRCCGREGQLGKSCVAARRRTNIAP